MIKNIKKILLYLWLGITTIFSLIVIGYYLINGKLNAIGEEDLDIKIKNIKENQKKLKEKIKSIKKENADIKKDKENRDKEAKKYFPDL